MDVVRAHFIASYFPSAFLLPFFFYLCCECYLCFPLDWCEKYLYNWIRFCFFHYCVTFWEIALQNGKHYSVHHKENGRPSSTWYCIIFSICISTFSSWTYVGNEMRSSRFKQFLSYLRFMFWCLQLHGSFWTLRCVRGARCQYLPQTDTFIFPSLRFSLPEIRSEGCLPRNRRSFWQEHTGLWRQSWRRKAERERTGACPSV